MGKLLQLLGVVRSGGSLEGFRLVARLADVDTFLLEQLESMLTPVQRLRLLSFVIPRENQIVLM